MESAPYSTSIYQDDSDNTFDYQDTSLSTFNNLVSDAKRRSLGMIEEENSSGSPVDNPFDGSQFGHGLISKSDRTKPKKKSKADE